MTYVYMATDGSNTVFHRRGQVKSPVFAIGLANQMARHALEVYVGHDIGPAVGRVDILENGFGRAYPDKVVRLVTVATRPPKSFWSRVLRR